MSQIDEPQPLSGWGFCFFKDRAKIRQDSTDKYLSVRKGTCCVGLRS
jgi:hypothetical protein